MTRTKTVIGAASILTILAFGLPAMAETEAAAAADIATQITTMITAQGYEVRRVTREDGLYEVYATRDGHRFELYVNDALEIVRSVSR